MRHATPSSSAVRLGDLLPGSRFYGAKDIQVSSLCGDSRHIRQGDLFAAMVGSNCDGHDFVREAIEKGAAAVLSERMLPQSVPTCIVRDTREAYGRICHAMVDDPSRDLNVVGITGTYGKTTVSMLISAIFEARGHQVGIVNSLGVCDGNNVDTSMLTPAPTAPEFARQLVSMRDNYCTHAVIETPSQGLARHSFAGLQVNGAVINNVRRAHMDEHGTVLAYRKIKQRLLSYLKPGGYAVINLDDPASRFVIDEINAPTLTFGTRHRGDVTATIVEQTWSEQTFLLQAGSESIPVRTRIVGNHHIQNCLAATAVGLINGIDLATIVRGLEAVDVLPGRMERIENGLPFATFVDSAASPDALSAALKAVRKGTTGRVFCVFGAQGECDTAERALLGRVAEHTADVSIITRNNPGREDQTSIAHDILDGFDRPARAHLLPDRARAIGWALHEAQPGDAVLIAGRGHETHESVAGRQVPFDDRQVARYFLKEIAARDSRRKAA